MWSLNNLLSEAEAAKERIASAIANQQNMSEYCLMFQDDIKWHYLKLGLTPISLDTCQPNIQVLVALFESHCVLSISEDNHSLIFV